MKVGMMTWFQYHNYGTALQVVALSKTLDAMGHMPFVIHYTPKTQVVKQHKNGVLADSISKAVTRIKSHPYHRYQETQREEKFTHFYEEYLHFTASCNILPKLEGLNSEFDAFVCGSDQIWSPSCFDPHYFLDFVSDERKMIAYAPSVGLSSIEDKNIEAQIKKLASRFEHISTREASGSEIIEDLVGKEVKTVLDPTFLLMDNDWRQLSSEMGKDRSPYLLVYMLGTNEQYWKEIYRIAERLHLQVKVIPVFFKDLHRTGCIQEAVGPEDFLSLVDGADYICTDSFHGTVFSIIFNKRFTVFERFKKGDALNQNSRIYNILSLLHLEERLICDKRSQEKIVEDIDYAKVNEILSSLRQQSLSYLQNALHNVEQGIGETDKVKNHVLKGHSLCCGCGACHSICPVEAIKVEMDKEGFYSALVNEDKCISCGKCRKVCPYIDFSQAKSINSGTLYSYKDSESDVLQKSSSGGIAYRLSLMMMNNGFSVVGCEFDRQTQKAKHIMIAKEDETQLCRLQGSKYMQSEFAPVMQQLMVNKKPVVIFGTPCQIAGVRRLLKKRDNIFLVDLICHGVPSYAMYKKYLDYLKNEKQMNVDGIETIFRYKPRGWREIYIYSENDGKSICTHQSKDPYFLMFEHGFCYAKGCYECPWRDCSAADIRIGDYWGTKYKTDTTGVSMVVVLTENGKTLLKSLKSSHVGKLKKEPIGDYFQCQQTVNLPRPVFWEELIDALNTDSRSFTDIINQYIVPFEQRKRLSRKIASIRSFMKRNG